MFYKAAFFLQKLRTTLCSPVGLFVNSLPPDVVAIGDTVVTSLNLIIVFGEVFSA